MAKEDLQTDHQRAEGIAGGHHQRPQEVADVCQELEDGDGSENRARKRYDQSPVHAEATGAIHQHIAHVDQYRLEIEHFGASVRSGTQPVLSLTETIENLATIEAIYRSAGYPWPIV